MSVVQANEVTYELHSLGWKAFQNLCATITGEIWGQTIQTFFDSHDGGRDGAFQGQWRDESDELFNGSFTVQCKFTAKRDTHITLSSLSDELIKAERLAKKGLSDNYILFSNANLTGANEEIIKNKFESVAGIKRFLFFGRERISQIIQESSRLRMLVPRIYGLGDLSQILDERAYDQAQEILSSLGDDLGKFIITEPYKQSAEALVKHGFVLLTGEPMCGKSTIAASLSIGALDEWGCSTIKVRDADDFVKHSNPHEKQLFWVDDAFGATQFDWSCVSDWNRTLPHINAAIKRGSKVIFTSRDYIYRSAKKHLKESALPVMKESQVVIHVENLTKEEREQILYNHIRLGNQPKTYKSKLIPFLPEVASHDKFSPEIARRLGNPLFTKDLIVSKYGLDNFVEKPLELLCEIINTMDDSSRSALALVFIRGGSLPSPIVMSEDEEQAIARLGGSVGEVTQGLEAIKDTLLLNSLQDGDYSWSFKHPTVRDAFAKIVASNNELMDIYLAGAPLDKLFSEISCGDVGVKGVSVIVPLNQYDFVIKKLDLLDIKKWFNSNKLYRFLSYRCDKEFLKRYIELHPNFISTLSVFSYIYASSKVDVLVRLYELNLLPKTERLRSISSMRELAVVTPDSGFLNINVRRLMTEDELSEILQYIQDSLLPNLDRTVDDWRCNYNSDEEPEVYFEDLKNSLNDYKNEFEQNENSFMQICDALDNIEQLIDDLRTDNDQPSSEDSDPFREKKEENTGRENIRSVFDDVDL